VSKSPCPLLLTCLSKYPYIFLAVYSSKGVAMLGLLFWFIYILYALLLTYLVLGFIISFEVVAAASGGKFAFEWIQKHFSYGSLYYSVIIFYPMIKLAYFFLEYLPSIFTHEIRCEFNLDVLFEELFHPHA
jgi:hypothetical protein